MFHDTVISYGLTLSPTLDMSKQKSVQPLYSLKKSIIVDCGWQLCVQSRPAGNPTVRRILKILEELSYRQLCLIKLFLNADQIDLDNFGNPNITQHLSSILTDCIEIRDKGLINSNNPLMQKIDELYLGSPSSPIFVDKHTVLPPEI